MPGLTRLLFFLSGCAALILEVLWTRQLALVFGCTVESASAAAATFLLGLGLGSCLGSRLAARSRNLLKTFALLELSVAASSFVVVLSLRHLTVPAAFLARMVNGPWLTSGRLLLTLLILGLPCLAMGASLPVLCEWLTRRGGRPFLESLAGLYAINTLGAAAGVLLTDFVLVQRLGVTGTGVLAVGLDLTVGLSALAAGRATAETGFARLLPPAAHGRPCRFFHCWC